MKISIVLEENLEEEIIIKCKGINDKIQKMQQAFIEISKGNEKYVFIKDNIEYYIELNEIIFFETSGNTINAHTSDSVYETKYRLYELEKMLPSNFLRVSKSTILNTNHVFSIDKNITASSTVQFYKTHKQVYVSRLYLKELRKRISERRNNYEN